MVIKIWFLFKMSSITIKIHYNKKVIDCSCNESNSLEDSLKEFTNAENKNLEDFVFYYKGSLIQNNSSIGLNNIFHITESNRTFKVFAYLISMNKKTEKVKNLIEKNEIKETKEIKESNIELNLESKTDVKAEDKKKIKHYYDVVCPECKTTAIIDKKNDFTFNILNCENFHFLKNINYNVYDDFIYDPEKLVDGKPFLRCGSCGARKMGIPYYCSCGINLCQDCKETNVNHEKHNKIELKKKNYYCIKHKEKFSCYCLDCNSNICSRCKESHSNSSHKILGYKEFMLKNFNETKDKVIKQRKQLNEYIKNIREKFEEMIDNIESYIDSYILIEESMINNYENELINFQLLRNLNNEKLFENHCLLVELGKIYKKEIVNFKFDSLKNIHDMIIKAKKRRNKSQIIPSSNEGGGTIKVTYKFDNEKMSENKYIKLFDEIFVKNNKENIWASINKREKKELKAYYRCSEDEKELNIDLIEKEGKKIVDMSYMFNNCKNLESVDFSNFYTTNVTSMEAMFQLCPLEEKKYLNQ